MVLLQECLQVWDEENSWPELAALGFFYLLTLSCDSDLGIVSSVCARLHQIITGISRNVNYDEVRFFMSIIQMSDNTLSFTDRLHSDPLGSRIEECYQ